jgi:Arc/MetJ-type ribon-helix-helix transcriptional regulator
MPRNLVHINVPTTLYELIEELVVKSGLYRSVPEFALECMRNKYHEMKQQKIERQKLNAYFRREKERRIQSASTNSTRAKD